MIPASIYSRLNDIQKEDLNIQRLVHLNWLRRSYPELARVASDATTDAFIRNPEISLPRSILEAYIALAIGYKSGETTLSLNEFENIKAVLDQYKVFN